MSSVWHPVDLSEGNEAAKIHRANVGVVVGPIFASPLESRFTQASLVQMLSTGVGWDALVAKHMNPSLQLTGFGVITAHSLSNKPASPPNPAALSAITPLVTKFICAI